MSKYTEMCKECIHYQMCGSINIDAPCAAYKNKTNMVEVVRCKDCRFWQEHILDIPHLEKVWGLKLSIKPRIGDCQCELWKAYHSTKLELMTKEEDYCSCGERR